MIFRDTATLHPLPQQRSRAPFALFARVSEGGGHVAVAMPQGAACHGRSVVMFNTDTDRAEDVSHAIAQEILRRLDLEGATCRQRWRTSLTATSVETAN
jgi:hypothetical protein